MPNVNSCFFCKYFHGVFSCDAFPDGIPLSILGGDRAHTKLLEGDKGIQFEVDEDTLALHKEQRES